MNKFYMFLAMIFISVLGWQIGKDLSSDSMAMAVGLLLGIMAGIPTVLLFIAAERHRVDRPTHSSFEKPKQSTPQITNVYHQHLHYYVKEGEKMIEKKRYEVVK